MKPTPNGWTRVLVALTCALVPASARLDAQPTGGQQAGAWTPAAVGVRFGWDGRTNGSLLGAHLRIPVLPSGHVEVVGGADMTFLRQTRDHQANVEVVYVPGGRGGGLYGGGGLGWRRGDFFLDEPRMTVPTRSLVVGLRSHGMLGVLGVQLELRWIFPSDLDFDPQPATLGVNLPLWGWNSIPRGGAR